MNQQGVTFLEIIVVIAILMITSALVAPSIQDWRQKQALESDYQALLAQIDYLKVRARTLNGTGLLICDKVPNKNNEYYDRVVYQLSNNNQLETNSVNAGFDAGIVENPSLYDSINETKYNVLSGETRLSSNICNKGRNSRGIFISSGKSGVEGASISDSIVINLASKSKNMALGGYSIEVSPSTGYVKKNKLSSGDVNRLFSNVNQ